jgi:uncharacterized membrane protein
MVLLGCVFLAEYSDRIDGTMPLTAFALRIVTFFFTSFAAMVLIRYALAVVDGGSFGKEEIKKLTPRWLSFVGGGLGLAVVVVVGLAALIVPGVYIFLRYGFVPQIIVDGEQSIQGAFKKSVSYTEGRKLELLRVYLLAVLLNIVGAAVFLVGLIITLPLTYVMLTRVYRGFKQDFEKPKAAVCAVG